MKAKDLAELLLKYPDEEVYIEDYHCPDFDDGYYYTNGTTGISRTPSGIFIDIDSINYYPKSPSEKPKYGSIGIMMEDGKWFKLREYDLSVLIDYDTNGYIHQYIGWNEDYYILAPNDHNDDWLTKEISSISSTHYTPDQVDYVQILVSIDDDTWEPTYEKLSLEEAINYAKNKTGAHNG